MLKKSLEEFVAQLLDDNVITDKISIHRVNVEGSRRRFCRRIIRN